MKSGILVQARMNSTRLPGKVLKPFFGDSSILEIVLHKLKTRFPHLQLILCTSVDSTDDVIAAKARELDISLFRGSQHDVLQRFTDAASAFSIDKVVRVCADNPFLDMDFLSRLLDFSTIEPQADYWSFRDDQGNPTIKTHLGFFAEIVTTAALLEVKARTGSGIYREHVTNFVYSSKGFDCRYLPLPNWLVSQLHLRLTVDDEQDFALAARLYQRMTDHDLDLCGLIESITPAESVQMNKNIEKYSK